MIPADVGGLQRMSSVKSHISISLDGFVAGPNQSVENPIGEGGMRLHEWAFATDSWREQHGQEGGARSPDSEVADEVVEGVGAYIMGRKMFGGGDGPWDETWTGWWGEDPPFHTPVFVLTHHEREPLPLQGGTTFTFVTGGIESALEQARAAAGDGDVMIAGGASAVQQYLAAGLLDELYLHVVPVLLGAGERLLENVGDLKVQQVHAIEAPGVTHIVKGPQGSPSLA
jgi:dihydrofolate reductase